MGALDWVKGDMLGLEIPAHSEALRAGGARFLSQAFHATGKLATNNRVAAITQCSEFSGGGTGRKLRLSVAYEKPQPGLHSDLFVKFSRDFDDVIRDRSRHMMEAEVRLAALSQLRNFPIPVPQCYFADIHQLTGTGILITECIAFGTGQIERQHRKCLDYKLSNHLEYYKALIKALARLAGTHKAGRLPERVSSLGFGAIPAASWSAAFWTGAARGK